MIKLYDYWRSSACYRLRIAFNLKGVAYESVEVSLHPDKLEQLSDAYRAINPQMRVPSVVIDGQVHSQSMALIDWLEETYPEPAFLPEDPHARLRARAFADTVACDIHPLNNSSILKYLREEFTATPEAVGAWYTTWVVRGFDALEVHARASTSRFLFGDTPGIAEICLIPQIYNARRFEIDLSSYPKLLEVEALCAQIEAFVEAAPEAVKPA
ncbi:MAG: maleylacetoacetate isomerase [Hyphomonadaceae bacterium]|nr:maleylacetoacetate isomerase [Hyphomonadaceae bacterium]